MKWYTIIALAIAVAIAVLFVLATIYVIIAPVGGCYCREVRGELKEIFVSDENRTVRFEVHLEYPEKVSDWTRLYISLNISGKYFALRYMGTEGTWKNGNYTAKIVDVNSNGVIDSGDYLIIHSNSAPFKTGDGIVITVSGICSGIYTTIVVG